MEAGGCKEVLDAVARLALDWAARWRRPYVALGFLEDTPAIAKMIHRAKATENDHSQKRTVAAIPKVC